MRKENPSLLKTPSNLRIANQIAVMEAIRKKPSSCSELSHLLSLSAPALKKITEELHAESLIIQYTPEKKGKQGRGREKVLYSLNDDLGVFASIDLSGRDLSYCLSDLSNRILARGSIPNVIYIDSDVLSLLVERVKEMLLSPAAKGRPLLGLCISSPGKIDPVSGYFVSAPRFTDYRKLNLREFFSSALKTEVEARNDIKLGLLGELKFGAIPKDCRNAFFAHIDVTSGSSFLFNGEIYLGSNGYSGEMPNISPVDEISSSYFDRFFTITDIFVAIKEFGKDDPDPFYSKATFSLSEVIDRYRKKDKIVLKAVETSAKKNALKLLEIANLLDPDCICLDGRILDFGKGYLDSIQKYFRLYDANCVTTSLFTSSLDHDANLLGAVAEASDHYLLSRFVEMAKKRTNRDDYDAEAYFSSRIQ